MDTERTQRAALTSNTATMSTLHFSTQEGLQGGKALRLSNTFTALQF